MRPRLLAGVLLAATLGLTACGGPSGEDSAAASPTCADGRIRMGVEPFEDPQKLIPAAEVLGDALERRLGCPVEVQVTDDYSAEVLAMRNDELELGIFGPLGFVFAEQRAGAEAVASFGTADGALSTYTAGLWVPADSDVREVAQLRDRTLALGAVGSTSGDALPRQALLDAGLREGDVRVDYAGGHPEALLALTNGKVDAAEINTQQLASAVESGIFDPSRFRQIWTSAPIPNDPVTVRGNTSPEFKAAVTDALLNLDAQAVGEIGALLDVDPPGKLVPVTHETYAPLFELAQKLGLTEEDVE
ncbi:Phosphonate ABC transporter phosphate-binding periplasmic component [Pseudonocardia sp. Ae168_Ps1]|uniref:phosphate/phosphite/phosphonate ABC transporter substrate-binding protein n=1 Tax=unclassified Pseudonocardia TaxID=2619320 RepID=UPI00094B189C|nr:MULTISPECIES: phosphate/phosphite/phosphonate ABC transporter substrate-binding protein [unclassified Pseudonocardia]OLL71770.1 Phosphonate ABC transporter phosphate-binding periplasmic component [Pseudonocardia sp. Ae150A_Ps1]OLL77738.1 Phosphonate ABC transporter phosphate-binding periplasmic component [Pseudonocardia sp. Ae168_Ps1]OLL88139.1 Phosphonate ABC transporter phosphate-binding periplasmic component [Pseudonocardia sp. Ae263_Ps1]OLL91835.1 Phosphonate ABC transporter phosphate-bi